MNDRTDFFRRSEAMFAFYADGRYSDALDVTEQLANEFPDEAASTSFWRVCLLSRLGKTDGALKAMSTALESGLWWSEMQLRADEDLSPLQGLPAFEAMVAECSTRQVEAQKDSKPGALIHHPAGEGPYPLLIALHGRSSSPERDFRSWKPILDMGWMLAMPQSSQLGSPNSFVWDDATRAQEEVLSLYTTLCDQHPVDEERVILAGFSQGAALAIQMCLHGRIPARGFLAVAPGRIAMEGLDEAIRSARGKRGYMVVGGRDRRHEMFAQVHDLLNQNGISCEAEDHPEMGHEFPPDFGTSLGKAIDFIFEEYE